jgi:two-component system, NtrC family, response regulator HydG
MLAEEVNYDGVLDLRSEEGVVQLAGHTSVLFDAVLLGSLRKMLIEDFGSTAARVVLTRFGFAHGFRLAETMKSHCELGCDGRCAGFHFHPFEGLLGHAPGKSDATSAQGALLLSSYEAQQHLMHFGRSHEPSCWTICGLLSGYLSRSSGKEIYVLEDRCMSRGDGACHLLGRTREQWGDERAAELRFFDKHVRECLEVFQVHASEAPEALAGEPQQRAAVTPDAEGVHEPLGIVAESHVMSQLFDLTRRVAKVDATIVVTGESGSGKERIARMIHDESPRAAGPFVAVNCGAVPDNLLESELFGHTKGAFSGASHDRLGLFEEANGGTLLLDEIGEISSAMQVKLLRVLQEREIRRVGENKHRAIDVRVVAATNRDLGQAVAEGSFRRDLFYRLKVVELHVPALRERVEDILSLAGLLLAEACCKMKRQMSGFSPQAAELMVRYSWPGNVRELQNVVERAVAIARGARIEAQDLPVELRNALPTAPSQTTVVRPLAELEREYILASLAFNGGNQTRTAEQLRIGSATLYRKLKAYTRAAETL